MSSIWHDSKLPSFLGVPPSFSFYEQAQVEIPAPTEWAMAQKYRHAMQWELGPDFHWEVFKRAHEVYLSKRPWWLGVV